jgi:hypothetical protein
MVIGNSTYSSSGTVIVPSPKFLADYPTTVRFNNKSRAIVFYDKEAETRYRLRRGRADAGEVPDSRGALRLEVRYLTPTSCKVLARELGLGKSFFPVDLLTPAAASHALGGGSA